jgi:nicotinamidase-related amidase
MGTQAPAITLKNLAVLIIDMQEYFIDSNEKEELVPNQIAVLQFCQKNHVPVAVIEYMHFGATIADLQSELEKISKEKVRFFTKDQDDAFSSKKLHKWLKENNVDTLILMGVKACACVFATAEHAIKNGYHIATSDDIIAGYCPICSRKYVWYTENTLHKRDAASLLATILMS